MYKINRIITIAFIIMIILFVMFFLNGMKIHNIAEKNITNDFLEQISQKESPECITEVYHYNNSKTIFFEKDSQQAVATYVKSLYFNRWKRQYLLQLNTEQLTQQQFTFLLDDNFHQYEMIYQLDENKKLFVEPAEQKKPLLAIRLFSIAVIITAAAIGRMVGVSMQRKKIK